MTAKIPPQSPLLNQPLDPILPPKAQIYDIVKEAIGSGKLIPGERLPSTEALAAHWKTHAPTVHGALTALVREGMLSRFHGRGTFVSELRPTLTKVAIYIGQEKWLSETSQFLHSIHRALIAELKRHEIAAEMWVDQRSEAEAETLWQEMRKAAQQRQFQGIILPTTHPALTQWMKKMSVPAAFLTSENSPGCVGMNSRKFMDMSLQALVKQGCRTAGLIYPVPRTALQAGDLSLHGQALEGFMDACREYGVQFRNQWICAEDDDFSCTDTSQEEFGHAAFHKIWSRKNRPEGLIVYPDTAVRGVLLGVAQNQVRVPQDLKLVLHRNADIPVFCPMPATWLISREQEMAAALLDQIQRQLSGRPSDPVMVGYHFEA